MLQNIFQRSISVRYFWILMQAVVVFLHTQKFVSAAVWYHWLPGTSSASQLPGSKVGTGRHNRHTHTAQSTEFN